MSYIKEPFEELDVMSDYLNNSLATDPTYGEEYCRLMIKNLIGYDVKKVTVNAQKVISPTDPEKRGIRLDIEVKEYTDNTPEAVINIFDIEPHRKNDIDSHPKKNRFYQAKLDAPLLKSGEKHYSPMPNLFIISITNYDPFGEDYMLYTIKNKCVEIPNLCYDDGVTIYYFNTAGTQGGSEELKQFLTYIEESTEENISNDNIRKLSTLVQYVKSQKSEEAGYMTWGDKIDGIVEEAVAEAVAEKDAEIARLKKLLESNKSVSSSLEAENPDSEN